MNRIMTSVAMLLTTLLVVPPALGQETAAERNAPRERPQRPAIERRSDEQGQAAQRVQRQVDELRVAHQELITQLRAIHATAVKEKATETAKQIERLIAWRQEKLQENLRQLELQRQQLERAAGEIAGRTDQPVLNRRAPEFSLNSFDGKAVKLADYKGKIVVLEWINLECPFSMYHHDKADTMTDLARKYKNKDVVWLAVNSTNQTTPEANREFAKKHKLPYPLLDDRSGNVGRRFGAITTPHMFIIDKTGLVVYDGAIDNAPLGKVTGGGEKIAYVDKALAELTSGKAVNTPKTQSYGCSVKYPTP